MEWIDVKDRLPPKEGKFLFYYYYGMGIGQWGQSYEIIMGNSERDNEKYILVLHPTEINDGGEAYQWDGDKLIEMDIYWRPLPEAPKVK